MQQFLLTTLASSMHDLNKLGVADCRLGVASFPGSPPPPPPPPPPCMRCRGEPENEARLGACASQNVVLYVVLLSGSFSCHCSTWSSRKYILTYRKCACI